MNRGERNIVIGGIVVTVLVTGGFTLSQGPLGPLDDNYQSPPEQIVMSEQSEIEVVEPEIEEETVQNENEEIIKNENQDIKEEQSLKEDDLEQEEVIETDAYDINKAYKKGEVVTYNGVQYKAKWWSKGENPQSYVDWEEVAIINEDGSESYAKGKHYVKGSIVAYEGNKYQAKWWTEATPGSNDSWRIIN